MKKIILMIVIAAFSMNGSYAADNLAALQEPQRGPEPQKENQGPAPRSMEDIKNMKIAYMTKSIGLTAEESQKFWPVYNKYWDERSVVARKRRALQRQIESSGSTEAQLKELIGLEREELNIFEKYIGEFKQVLSVEKVGKIFTADEEFKKFLMSRASERSGGREPR